MLRMRSSPHLAANSEMPRYLIPLGRPIVRDITPNLAPQRPIRLGVPAWAMNAPPSSQSRFEGEYPKSIAVEPHFSSCDVPNTRRPENLQAVGTRSVHSFAIS